MRHGAAARAGGPRLAGRASRAQVARQLLIESLILAGIGGALGFALASALLKVVIALMPPDMLPTESNVKLNVPVLLFTLAVCGLSGILFGAAPAWQAARGNVNEVLKEGARSLRGGGRRLRHAFVVVEFALALTLLAAGGLAVQSLMALTHRDLGFRIDHLLTFSLPVDQNRFVDAGQITVFYRQLIERVRALQGVASASVSTGMPVLGAGGGLQFSIAGRPPGDPTQRSAAGFSTVSPEYFRTFGMRIMRGRAFTDQDRATSVPVAIVNERFVRAYLPDADPLTQRLVMVQVIPGSTTPGPPIERQIVGVYADVLNAGPANSGFPEIDVPFWQSPWPDVRMAVRAEGDLGAVRQSIAAVIQSINPELPMADVKTMEQLVSASLMRDRFNTVLFGGFAVVGLLLAAFGVYGVMSFLVSQRTHEIGLRMALGADRRRILRQIVREGMTTAFVGTAIGSAGAFYAARTMQGIVFGVTGMDPLAFLVVTMTLLGAALIACVVPAVRAASVDPMVALRQGYTASFQSSVSFDPGARVGVFMSADREIRMKKVACASRATRALKSAPGTRERTARPSILRRRLMPHGSWRRRECHRPRTRRARWSRAPCGSRRSFQMRACSGICRQIPAGDHEPLGVAQHVGGQPVASRPGADEDEHRVDVLELGLVRRPAFSATRSTWPFPSTRASSVRVRSRMFGVFSICSIRYRDIVSRNESRRTTICTSFA